MLHVCYALYDKTGKFSKITGTSICSIFENTEAWVTIHLLHDDTLTEENRQKFIRLARNYGNHIVFYDMEALEPELMKAVQAKGGASRFSPATLYRLMTMRVLPHDIPRLIYLDSDIIVNCDIRELWQEEVGANGLAAVPESVVTYGNMVDKDICKEGVVPQDAYFNAGVLLLDMDAYRQHEDLLEQGLAFLDAHPTYNCFDQDILNHVFSSGYRKLPLRYDYFVEAERIFGTRAVQPGIYHYAGQAFRLYDSKDCFNQLFSKYYQKTPWYEDTTLLRACQNAMAAGIRLFAQMMVWARGRRIAYCGNRELLPVIQQKIPVFPGTLFVNAVQQDGRVHLDATAAKMQEVRQGAPTFFVFMGLGGSAWQRYLQQQGFRPGEDFMDGTPVLNILAGSEKITPERLLDVL